MGARYYGAGSENGDRVDDPSEDALFIMNSDLDDSGNTFLVVQPDGDAPVWFASVAVLDEGGYEIVRRDTTRNEHEVTSATSINDIARDLTVWMAARDFPGRPARQVTDCQDTPWCSCSGSLEFRHRPPVVPGPVAPELSTATPGLVLSWRSRSSFDRVGSFTCTTPRT